VDWNKIKREYIQGDTSYRKLADKYNVPFGTLRKVAAKEKWRELRDKTRLKADTKIVEAEAEKQAKRMTRLLSVTDTLLDAVEKAVNEFNTADLLLDKGVLKSLSGAIKDIKEIQGIKSDIDIREQEARIANLRKNAETEDTSKEIKVTIVGDLDEYSN
jgi:transposase-like protein